jgi:hypothetical protein
MIRLFGRPLRNPKFVVGEVIKIKSADEIMKSLVSDRRALDGCLFTEQMRRYCGDRYEVLKVVNSIFNEHKQRTFKTKSTLYILENLICHGNVEDFSHKCDRTCFLLWHEAWLEKAL